MSQDILVFAAKRVGLELVGYLLDINAPVCRIIVGSNSDGNILDLARSRQVPAEVYCQGTQTQLVQESRRYEWLLNFWSPHILGQDVLKLANYRLNTHPGLVPICQGNDTAAWTIRKGMPAGVSLLEMRAEVDAGEVYVNREISYSFPTKGKELYSQMQQNLIDVSKESWPPICAGELVPTPQQGPVGYHTRKQTERDRVLYASTKATLEELLGWALAHDFDPGTTAEVRYNDRSYRLTIDLEPISPDTKTR